MKKYPGEIVKWEREDGRQYITIRLDEVDEWVCHVTKRAELTVLEKEEEEKNHDRAM